MGKRRADDDLLLPGGLEIRRELHEGELAKPRRAALPVAAAIGGMVTRH